MKRYLTFLKTEGKLWMRCPDCLIFGLAMPLGVLLLIGLVGGDKMVSADDSYTFLQSAFASVAVVGICATAFMSIPLTVAEYRDKKILKHLFVTPCSPVLFLGVIVTLAGIVSILSALSVAAATVFGFVYRMPGNPVVFAGAYLLVMASMFSMGTLLAGLCKNMKVTNVACSLVYFPMLFLSGATVPFEIFPAGLQNVAAVLPLTQGVRLMKEISLGMPLSSVLVPVVILTGITIVCTIAAAFTFRWE